MLRPNEPFITVVELFNATTSKSYGVEHKSYTKVDNINCSFKTYGGTDYTENGVLSVIDTATVTTWYRPDIKSSSMIKVNGKSYEILGEPEDIELRHQFLKFKVRSVKGGV